MPAEATNQSVEQTPQSGQQPAQQPAQGQQQASGQPTGQQPQQQSSNQRPDAAQNSGNDDQRVRGIIADLQRERQARQQLEQRLAASEGTLEQERRRIRALAGVETPSPEQAELDAVRARVVEMFPVLAKLSDEKVDQLLGLSEQANDLTAVTNNHWERHGQAVLNSLTEQVSEVVGQMSDRQTKALQRAFVAECESDPEFFARYQKGDPKLVEEFAKAWVEDWFEPARRTIVSQEASRFRRVPNGRDRTVQTTPPKKVDFKDQKAVEDAMVESFRSHGGRFEN